MAGISSHRQLVRAVELREWPARAAADNYFLNGITELWQGRQRGELLPGRADFPPESLRRWIGWVSLVDVTHHPLRFRWRLVGSEIVSRMGRDSTGKSFQELYDEDWLARYTVAYSLAVTRRAPVYFRGNLEFVGKEFAYFTAVHLPLADDGRTVDKLLLALDFD